MTFVRLLLSTLAFVSLVTSSAFGKERPLCPILLGDDEDLSAYIGNNRLLPHPLTGNLNYMSFPRYVGWMRANNVTSRGDFIRRFVHTGLKPDDIPDQPDLFYGASWRVLIMIAGTVYKTLPEFLEWTKEVGIQSQADFRKRFGSAETRPSDVPANPEHYYDIFWKQISGRKPGRARDPSKRGSRYYNPSATEG